MHYKIFRILFLTYKTAQLMRCMINNRANRRETLSIQSSFKIIYPNAISISRRSTKMPSKIISICCSRSKFYLNWSILHACFVCDCFQNSSISTSLSSIYSKFHLIINSSYCRSTRHKQIKRNINFFICLQIKSICNHPFILLCCFLTIPANCITISSCNSFKIT